MAIYSKRGVHGQTVREVARRIMSGDYPEGATIDIATLESELQVSRTALREALKVLAAKGLVDARQNRGTFVRPRSDWNLLDADVIRWRFADRTDDSFLDDLHEVRGVIEPAAARLAAERRTGEDLAALEEALDAMAQADGDPRLAVSADLAFHRTLLASAHNEIFERMEILLETGLAARDALVHGTDPHADPVPNHRAVFAAVQDADPARAESAMQTMLREASEDLQRARRRVSPASHEPERGGPEPSGMNGSLDPSLLPIFGSNVPDDRSGAEALMPIFRSRHQADLLTWLLMHPDQEFTATELAARFGVPLTTLHREVQRLVEADLLRSRPVGRARLLSANPDHRATPALTRLLEVTLGQRRPTASP